MSEMKYKKGDKVLIEAKVLGIDYRDEDGRPYRLEAGNSNGVRATQKQVEDLPSQQKPEFELGELVEVSDDGEYWVDEFFLGISPGEFKYIVACESLDNVDFSDFYELNKKNIVCYKYIKKIQKSETQENKLENLSLDELLAEIKRRNEKEN